MIRALWQNYRSGGTVSGASTITQQLARALLLSPEERAETGPIRESTRDQSLPLRSRAVIPKTIFSSYILNEIYYGNLGLWCGSCGGNFISGKSAKEPDDGRSRLPCPACHNHLLFTIFTTTRMFTLLRQQQVLVLHVPVEYLNKLYDVKQQRYANLCRSITATQSRR